MAGSATLGLAWPHLGQSRQGRIQQLGAREAEELPEQNMAERAVRCKRMNAQSIQATFGAFAAVLESWAVVTWGN